MTPAQISALRAVSERCRAAGSRVWLEPAAVDALLKDVERYQWLRDEQDWYAEPRLDEEDGTKWELVFYSPQRIEDPTDDDNLDAAIDAAMKGTP